MATGTLEAGGIPGTIQVEAYSIALGGGGVFTIYRIEIEIRERSDFGIEGLEERLDTMLLIMNTQNHTINTKITQIEGHAETANDRVEIITIIAILAFIITLVVKIIQFLYFSCIEPWL
jgi:type IV secretory pathway TrbL component